MFFWDANKLTYVLTDHGTRTVGLEDLSMFILRWVSIAVVAESNLFCHRKIKRGDLTGGCHCTCLSLDDSRVGSSGSSWSVLKGKYGVHDVPIICIQGR